MQISMMTYTMARGLKQGEQFDVPALCRFTQELKLNAIDWDKGCYLGQELTARTRYRGLVRKRLLPVTIEGPTPAPGTTVMLGDKEAGEMRSAIDGIGLALLRLEHVEGDAPPALRAGEAKLTEKKPDWVRLPEAQG